MDRVIVLLEPSFFRHEESGRFAARFSELGLTSFGETREESLDSLKRLFVTFVKVRRENGTLENFLNATGVEWYPESSFPPDKGDVEYLVGTAKATTSLKRSSIRELSWRAEKAALPLAA